MLLSLRVEKVDMGAEVKELEAKSKRESQKRSERKAKENRKI